MRIKPMPKQFKHGDVIYEQLSYHTRISHANDDKMKCACGNEEYFLELVYSPESDNNNKGDWMTCFDSMEASIVKCKKCGRLYLEREVGDYDFMDYQEVKIIPEITIIEEDNEENSNYDNGDDCDDDSEDE
jgi:hypothetical protein